MIPILMYHQISDMPPVGTPFRGLCVPPKKFAQQMRWLKRLGYRGLSMQDLLPYIRGEKRGRVFGITFDDGYTNVLEHALPVLRDCHFSSTVYFVAGHPGGYNFWDQDKGIARTELMSIGQIEQWRDGGQEIGSHTLDHVTLAELPPEQAYHQMKESKRRLEALFQVSVNAFCFPYGSHTPQIVQQVRDLGYTNATTTERGLVAKQADLFALPRVTISGTIDLFSFLVKVLTRKEHRPSAQPPHS